MQDLSGTGGLLRSGRTARITILAEDPDGDSLTYALDRVPEHASFDRERGVLTWRPTREQEGEHELELQVTDGELSAKRSVVFVVSANRPPADTGEHAIVLRARDEPVPDSALLPADAEGTIAQLAQDPDGDELTFRVLKQPAGARVVASRGSVSFVWNNATGADVGEHELIVSAADDVSATTVRRTVVVIPEWAARDYTRFLLPGAGASAFLAHDDGELFVGGAFDVTFVAVRGDWRNGYLCGRGLRTDDCHASHHRFYAEFEVLASTRDTPSLFTYGIGYSASFEWNPSRRYLIPHYGIEIGGLVRSELGHRAQTRPYLGLHLWAGEQIWLNATLGYRVVPAELVDLSGPTATLRVIMNPW
jgi:hypothetical protein